MTRRNPWARLPRPRIDRRRVRHDDFRVANQSDEIRLQYADDRERLAVQDERLAHHVERAAESPLPEAMADQRRRTRLVIRRQRPAQLDLSPRHLEVVCGDAHGRETFGVPPAGEVCAPSEHRDEAVQRVTRALEVFEIRQRERLPIGSWPHDREREQAITAGGIRRQWSAATLQAAGRVAHVEAFIDLLATRARSARRRPLPVGARSRRVRSS